MIRSRRIGLVVVVLLMVAGLWGYRSMSNASVAIDPARIATVERGDMVRSVVATGKIEPITTVEVKSKANGIIEALHADVGQVVSPGEILAELDRENLTARLREARANLQAAEAAHTASEAELRRDEIEAEAPDVEFARRNLSRAEQLFEQELLAQEGFAESRSTVEQAENHQRALRGQLLVSRARVTQAAANVAQAVAAVEQAEEELTNATLRAPIRATVLTRDVEVGSPVSSILNLGANATLVMTLGDIDQVFVRGQVDEADIGQVSLGQSARITTETFRERTFTGRVTQISPIGVEENNVTTFEVEISIDNPGQELKANMTANAEIVLEELPGSVILAEAAVAYDADRNAFVDLLDPDAAGGRRRVPVTLGYGDGTRVQVLDGLEPGDRVILPG